MLWHLGETCSVHDCYLKGRMSEHSPAVACTTHLVGTTASKRFTQSCKAIPARRIVVLIEFMTILGQRFKRSCGWDSSCYNCNLSFTGTFGSLDACSQVSE